MHLIPASSKLTLKSASINDGDEESNEAVEFVVLDLNQIQSEPTRPVTICHNVTTKPCAKALSEGHAPEKSAKSTPGASGGCVSHCDLWHTTFQLHFVKFTVYFKCFLFSTTSQGLIYNSYIKIKIFVNTT